MPQTTLIVDDEKRLVSLRVDRVNHSWMASPLERSSIAARNAIKIRMSSHSLVFV